MEPQNPQRRKAMSPILLALCAVWLVCILIGSALLLHYKTTAGRDRVAPASWPSQAQFVRDTSRPTLLLFLHPRCSCSAATLSELERMLASAAGRASVHLFFYRPKGTAPEWAHSDLYRRAAAIPEVTVHEDEDGAQARLFHAQTSGHVVLYAANGIRMFDGGITIMRGHEGESAGRAAITGFLLGEPATTAQTPIFGCEIDDAKPTAKPAN